MAMTARRRSPQRGGRVRPETRRRFGSGAGTSASPSQGAAPCTTLSNEALRPHACGWDLSSTGLVGPAPTRLRHTLWPPRLASFSLRTTRQPTEAECGEEERHCCHRPRQCLPIPTRRQRKARGKAKPTPTPPLPSKKPGVERRRGSAVAAVTAHDGVDQSPQGGKGGLEKKRSQRRRRRFRRRNQERTRGGGLQHVHPRRGGNEEAVAVLTRVGPVQARHESVEVFRGVAL